MCLPSSVPGARFQPGVETDAIKSFPPVPGVATEAINPPFENGDGVDNWAALSENSASARTSLSQHYIALQEDRE
jgi:hypothetical protein